MNKGYLSQYFEGVVAKRLSSVEIDGLHSNQHEFNGTNALKCLFGRERLTLTTRFLYVDDEMVEVSEDGILTWYDARERNPERSEFRLYYKAPEVSKRAQTGDPLFVILKRDGTALVIIAPGESTIASQIAWLFGVNITDEFSGENNFYSDTELGFAARRILDEIGVVLPEPDGVDVDEMFATFNGAFPSTKTFSEFARSKCEKFDKGADPDSVIVTWFAKEEELFRAFEKGLIDKKLSEGFSSVDDFISYSLSVQNRRKSRAGHSFENHLSALFNLHELRFDQQKITENKERPDFIFPGIREYHEATFQVELLTMLGAKSTCKDRWRQVLQEASRIRNKHLITLETAISVDQTTQMQSKNLQLVVPRSVSATYTPKQQEWLMSVEDFIGYVKEKQMRAFT